MSSLEASASLESSPSDSTSSDGSPPANSSSESTSSDGSPPAKVRKLDISSSKGKAVRHKVGIKTDSKCTSGADVFSLTHVAEYFASVKAKGGFDVPYPPQELDDFCSLIHPWEPLTEGLCQILKPLCNAAIAHFNQNEHKNYEFVKLVKANSQAARGARFYLTFEACNLEDGTNQTLQAVVLRGIPKVVGELNLEVHYCKREADFKGGI